MFVVVVVVVFAAGFPFSSVCVCVCGAFRPCFFYIVFGRCFMFGVALLFLDKENQPTPV